jgi:TolA-binding protein
VYPDPRVVEFVSERFVPVRVHIRENQDEYKRLGGRYGVQWTPTILILDDEGVERHRVEGFLPVDDFLSQLAFGVARAAFQRQQYAEAERLFREVVERYGQTDAAPEALYWAGVSTYRATSDPSALKATGKAFSEQYPDSIWAKKASVWK